jgi:hypothetical protein
VVLILALAALAFGLALPAAPRLTEASPLAWQTFGALAPFAVGVLVALVIQGGRMPASVLWTGALAATALSGTLHVVGRSSAAPAWLLAREESALLAAVLWGTCLARPLRGSGELLAVVLCAAAGDAWFTVLRVPESVSETHPAHWLRLAGPLSPGGLNLAPSFTDVLFVALYLEAARRLRFRRWSTTLGALGGYALAAFLALASRQPMPALPLVGLGVLSGSWPYFRCHAADVLRALALAMLLFALLLSLSVVRRWLHPPGTPRPESLPVHNVAETGGLHGSPISACTTAGIVFQPNRRQASSRWEPTTSRYLPEPAGATTMGWSRPWLSMSLARASTRPGAGGASAAAPFSPTMSPTGIS